MVDILKGVIQEGTGKRARILNMSLAGKTGTTDDYTDAWFAGFSPDITTVVWVGYDKKKKIGKHITGARGALPIWIDYMASYYADKKIRDFELPENVVYVPIDPKTHLISVDNCEKKEILFVKGTEPAFNCRGELALAMPKPDNLSILDEDFILKDYEDIEGTDMENQKILQDNSNGEENFIFDLR